MSANLSEYTSDVLKLTLTFTAKSLVFLVHPSPKQSEYIARRATSTNNHTNDVNKIMRHVCILILLLNIVGGDSGLIATCQANKLILTPFVDLQTGKC